MASDKDETAVRWRCDYIKYYRNDCLNSFSPHFSRLFPTILNQKFKKKPPVPHNLIEKSFVFLTDFLVFVDLT
jgi:hypothetical protein